MAPLGTHPSELMFLRHHEDKERQDHPYPIDPTGIELWQKLLNPAGREISIMIGLGAYDNAKVTLLDRSKLELNEAE